MHGGKSAPLHFVFARADLIARGTSDQGLQTFGTAEDQEDQRLTNPK